VGRPCEFDEAEALDRAMAAFWKGGFEATGLDELQEATGVGRQSLYNKFGDKRALFLRCVRHYQEKKGALLRDHFAAVRPVAEAFRRLFEGALEAPDEEKRMGCFMVNTAMELARNDVEVGDLVARGQRGMEDGFAAALEAGRDRRELPRDFDCRAVARFLLGTLLGLKVLQKSDPRSAAGADMAKVALQVFHTK
jgi:TetR/AcrR family transcriptional regulator, transcriptional repressor for nem operon